YGMWGNFNTGYMGNELAHVDRGLYGGNLHYGSDSTTRFGERRFSMDGFAAQPGTLASYQEFRGTGGSLYFLRHQDILTGSERVRRDEYTPGFTQLNALSSGGQSHVWLSNHIQLGLTANSNKARSASPIGRSRMEGDAESNLGAADMTLRMSAKSFLKVQAGRS